MYDNNLKQSKTKFELRTTLNENLSNKNYNSVNWKMSKVPVINYGKTSVYINMECLHCFLSCEKGILNTGSN